MAEDDNNRNTPAGADAFYRPLRFDPAKFESFFEDYDISEEQKQAQMQAVWLVASSFADYGWGVHPIQQVDAQVQLKLDVPSLPMLSSSQSRNQNNECNAHAAPTGASRGEEEDS